MKELQIIGNIGQDATITVVQDRKFINFSVAINESYKDKQGTKVEKTTWVDCFKVVTDSTSTAILPYLKKGTQVMVRGDVSAKAWTSKQDGSLVAGLNLRADKIKLLGSSQVEPQAGTNRNSQPATTEQPVMAASSFASEPDDLPF